MHGFFFHIETGGGTGEAYILEFCDFFVKKRKSAQTGNHLRGQMIESTAVL